MKTALWCGLVVCAALLSGCGNACDHEKRASDSLNNKLQSCGSSASSSFDVNKCQNNLHQCSQDDITKLDGFASCLEGLQGCPPSTSGALAGGELGCLQQLSGISGACLQSQ